MKVFNRVQVMDYGELRLHFNERLAAAVGITEGVCLHGLALERVEQSSQRVEQEEQWEQSWASPSQVLVLSPFAITSWCNLVRASFTVRPGSGALWELMKKLHSLSLCPRYLESTNGADLSHYAIYRSGSGRISSDENDFIIPTVVMTLELPGESGSGDPEVLQTLRRVIDEPDAKEAPQYAAAARRQLHEETGVAVDWVSPMRTLNRLGRLANFGRDFVAVSAEEETSELHRTLLRAERTRIRKTFVVAVGESGNQKNPYSIRIDPWAEAIWERRYTIPDILPARPADQRLALCYADAGEKLICWDVFDPRQAVLIALHLLMPTGGFEHNWWEWVFETIKEAGGNALTAHTSARLDGDWGMIDVVVLFPLQDKQRQDRPGAILECLRRLQGREGGTTTEEALEFDRETVSRLESRDLLSRKEAAEPRFESTLHVNNFWDLRGSLAESEPREPFKLAENPFSFTSSLDHDDYEWLYGEDYTRNSSLKRLSEKIIKSLERKGGSQRENTLIVGAHRSGKTTLLKLIEHDLKDREEIDDSKPRPRAFLISPSSVMPFQIFIQLLESIEEWANEDPTLSERWAHKLKRFVAPVKGAWEEHEFKGGQVMVTADGKIASGSISGRFGPNELKDLRDGLQALERLTPQQLSQELVLHRDRVSELQLTQLVSKSVDVLEEVLRAAEKELLDEGAASELIPVVLIDEFDRFSDAGSEPFVRAWREVIERSRTSWIRWVVTSARSAEESGRLQPMSGVFRERVLGPLSAEDCDHLMDRFSGIVRKPTKREGERATPEGAGERSQDAGTDGSDDRRYAYQFELEEPRPPRRPVLTFTARGLVGRVTARLPYFLQVYLLHLYEFAEEQVLPVINRHWCERVLFAQVLPELSDYLAAQWERVAEDVRSEIEGELCKCTPDPREFLQSYGAQWSTAYPPDPFRYRKPQGEKPEEVLRPDPRRYTARARKMLQRVGLSGADETIIAPLVAVWLLERRQRAVDPTAAGEAGG